MTKLMGTDNVTLAVPASIKTRRISSVAYATEDSASDEKTAKAIRFERRSWTACAVLRGSPNSQRLNIIVPLAAYCIEPDINIA